MGNLSKIMGNSFEMCTEEPKELSSHASRGSREVDMTFFKI